MVVMACLFVVCHNTCTRLLHQIDYYAQRDLKRGLQLFGTEGNVGLTNAWMIVQTDVSCVCVCAFVCVCVCVCVFVGERGVN